MSDKYTRFFMLTPNLFAVGSPVLIEAGALLKDNANGQIIGQLKLCNLSKKTIKAIQVKIQPTDAFEKVGESFIYQYLDLSIKPSESFGSQSAIFFSDNTVRSFSAAIVAVGFNDGTLWSANNAEYVPLPEGISIENDLVYPELAAQYRKDIAYEALYKPITSEENSVWMCTCGAWNSNDDMECRKCGCGKDLQFLKYNMSSLSDENYAAKKELKENVERKIKEEKIARETEEREAKEKAQKRKKLMKFIFPVLIIFIVLIIGSYIYMNYIVPSQKYNNAISLSQSEDYGEAEEVFVSLGDYKDSVKQAKLAHELNVEQKKEQQYQKALQLLSENRYEDACIILKQIQDYCDVIYDEIIVGFGFFKSCIASFDNFGAAIAGAEATQTTERLESIKNSLRNRVKEKAVKMGANALVGIDFEQSGMGDLIMVSMTATAVSIEKNEEKISEEQCFQKNV